MSQHTDSGQAVSGPDRKDRLQSPGAGTDDAHAPNPQAGEETLHQQDGQGATNDAVLKLRARPRPVQGLRRGRIILLFGILGFGLLLTIAAAFDPPKLRSASDAAPIGNPGGLPQSIQDLPRTYGEIRPGPAPAGERPAQPPTIAAAQAAAVQPATALIPGRSDLDQEREAERKRRLRKAQQAREAGVFFALTRASQTSQSGPTGRTPPGGSRGIGALTAAPAGGPGAIAPGLRMNGIEMYDAHMNGAQMNSAQMNDSLSNGALSNGSLAQNSLAAPFADHADPIPGMLMSPRHGNVMAVLLDEDGLPLAGIQEAAGFHDPAGDQRRKSAFLQQSGPGQTLNRHQLKPLASPYLLLAGHVISAALVTGINSDLPGLVKAQVTGPVYDSVSGDHLLIPPGAQLLGRYDSVISHGQSRVLVVWHRLILPDGSSMVLEPMPGSDGHGRAGLEDAVDFHGTRLAAGVALASLLGVAAELSFGEEEDAILRALRRSAQRSTNRAGQRLTERNLAIQPTITIRPGWPVTILVTRDLALRPWRP